MSKGKLVIHKRSYNPNNEGHVKSLIEDCIAGEREMTAKRVAHQDKLREQIKTHKECKAQPVEDVEGKSVLITHKRSNVPDAEKGLTINNPS